MTAQNAASTQAAAVPAAAAAAAAAAKVAMVSGVDPERAKQLTKTVAEQVRSLTNSIALLSY